AAYQHLGNDLTRPQERTERVHTPGLLEYLGRGVQEGSEGAPAAVVDEYVRRPECAADLFVRGRDLLLDRCVALYWPRDTACGPDLFCDRAGDVGAPRHERDTVALCEP